MSEYDDIQRDIESLRAHIHSDEYHMFDEYYRLRLQEFMQSWPESNRLGIDPYAAEAAFLEELRRESEGRDNDGPLCLVPTSIDEETRIQRPERDPHIAQRRKKGTVEGAPETKTNPVLLVIGIVAIIISGAYMVYSLMFRGEEEPVVTVTSDATEPTISPLQRGAVGEVAVAHPASLEIETEEQNTTLRVLEGTTGSGGVWEPELEDGVAVWLSETYINSVFCLSPAAQAMVAQFDQNTRIHMRPVSGAVRTYQVSRVFEAAPQQIEVLNQSRAGMTLLVCGANTPERTVVEAVFLPEPIGQQVGATGEPQDIDGLRVTLASVEPTENTATLPIGYHRVAFRTRIRNISASTLDTTRLINQLEANQSSTIGETTPTQIASGDTITQTFYYDIPQDTASGVWRLTAQDGSMIAIATDLPAPSEQSNLVAQIDQQGIEITTNHNQPTVTIPVTITSSETMQLDNTMVTVRAGEQTISTTTTPALPARLMPDEPYDLTISFSAPPQTVLLDIANQQWQLTIAQQEGG